MNKKKAEGKCLCGDVKIHAEEMSIEVGVCHCSMCRNWNGGPYFAVDCGTKVTIDGKENVTVYNSSDWGERSFCKNCGTHLYYRLKETNQFIVSSEIFDDPEFIFHHQIFVDEKPRYYEFANQTKNMTGAEVFAIFNSSQQA